jgi:hypothetical protein
MRRPISNSSGLYRESIEVQIVEWLKCRFTTSRYVSHRVVPNCISVAEDQDLPLDYGNDHRLAELLGSANNRARNLNEIARPNLTPRGSGWTQGGLTATIPKNGHQVSRAPLRHLSSDVRRTGSRSAH